MDLTPEALRSARFREKLRGYHPDDVDAFLESVAEGLGVLLGRLRDATERVRRVETGAAASDAEESVRRTLVLAQRTADLAIAEAREAATKLVGEAEARAAAIIGTAQDTALATAERAQEQLRADLDRLQGARDQLSADVRALEQWLAGERTRLKHALSELADRAESVRSDNAPVIHASVLPARPTRPAPVAPSPAPAPPPAAAPPIAAPPAEPEPAPDIDSFNAHPATGEPRGAARTFAPAPPPEPRVTPRAPRPPVEEPSPDPIPAPAPAPWIATTRTPPAPIEPEPMYEIVDLAEVDAADETARDPDAAVLMRAQAAAAPPRDDSTTEDPYFAELRRAISDPRPLGPRDDDDEDEVFEASVEDIFDSRRSSRLRRRR